MGYTLPSKSICCDLRPRFLISVSNLFHMEIGKSGRRAALLKCGTSTNSHPLNIIPGPAGIVQAAMRQRELGKNAEPVIATQEFIERAVTEAALPDHTDFNKKPWQTAVEYGYFDMEGYVDLSTLKIMYKYSRVGLSVAVVQSKNDSGNFILELKDRTATVLASLLHKAEKLFEGKIKVGACLVINDYVTFCPKPNKRSPLYVNITEKNLANVFEP